MVECELPCPIPVPLYLITHSSSALASVYHEFWKTIQFRHMKVFRAWSGKTLLNWDLRSSRMVPNVLPCWGRITAARDLTPSLPTPCGTKNQLRALFTAAAQESWSKVNMQRTSRGVPMQYRIYQRGDYCSWTRKTTVLFSKFWGFEVYLFSNRKWQQGLLKFSETGR